VIAIRLLKDGVPIREAVIAALPATFGRGADCEFVLADPSVSRHHARLERDAEGRLVLVDLGSRNGLNTGDGRLASLFIGSATRCRLGESELEVVPVADDPTIEVRADALVHEDQRRGLAHHAAYLLLGVAGVLVLEVLSPGFWSPWQRSRASELLGSTIGVLFGLPLFAFLLFVALKAAGRRVRVADTLLALARAAWVLPAVFVIDTVLRYVLPGGAYGPVSALLGWASSVVVIVSLVRLRRERPSRAFDLGWASAITLLWAGIALTSSLASKRLGLPQNDYSVRPPVMGYSGVATGLDSYLQRLEGAAEDASRAAEDVRVSQDER
jgi:hypothetical protein